jgi:hypothetical protein
MGVGRSSQPSTVAAKIGDGRGSGKEKKYVLFTLTPIPLLNPTATYIEHPKHAIHDDGHDDKQSQKCLQRGQGLCGLRYVNDNDASPDQMTQILRTLPITDGIGRAVGVVDAVGDVSMQGENIHGG